MCFKKKVREKEREKRRELCYSKVGGRHKLLGPFHLPLLVCSENIPYFDSCFPSSCGRTREERWEGMKARERGGCGVA